MMPWSEGWGTCVHPGRKSQNSCQDWQNMLKNSTKFFLLRGVHDGTFFGPSSALGECRLSPHAWIWTSFYEWRNQKMRNTKKTGLRTSQCVIPGPCYRTKKTMVSSQLLNRKNKTVIEQQAQFLEKECRESLELETTLSRSGKSKLKMILWNSQEWSLYLWFSFLYYWYADSENQLSISFFSRREDISKCLYEYRVIITCYKKNLGDLDGC